MLSTRARWVAALCTCLPIIHGAILPTMVVRAIIPTAPGQIGVDPVSDLMPESQWQGPSKTKWIGVDTAYLTQGPAPTPNAPPTTVTPLSVVTATAVADGIAVGDVYVELSSDVINRLTTIAQNVCGPAGIKAKRQGNTVVSCAYEFAKQAVAKGGPMDLNINFNLPIINTADVASIVSTIVGAKAQALAGIAVIFWLSWKSAKNVMDHSVVIKAHNIGKNPYPTTPYTPDPTKTTSDCAGSPTSTICSSVIGCPKAAGKCSINTVSCSPSVVGCQRPNIATATSLWIDPAPSEDFNAWKLVAQKVLAAESSYYASASAAATPLAGKNWCNGLGTPMFVNRDVALANVKSFCEDPGNLKAANSAQRVHSFYGTDHPDGTGNINTLDFMDITIFYHSPSATRITSDQCKFGLGQTIDNCDAANNPGNGKHGGQYSADNVDLSANALMQRVKFYGSDKIKSKCDSSNKNKYAGLGSLKASIANFCSDASGALKYPRPGDSFNAKDKIYNDGTPEAIKFNIKWNGNGGKAYQWYEDECTRYLGQLGQDCPVFPNTNSIFHWGGTVSVNGIDFSALPQWVRQDAVQSPKAACATWYTGRGKKWEVHGAGWELDNAGKDLLDWTNHDAGTEWHFQYTGDNADNNHKDPEGMEWVGFGMYRVNIYTDEFIENAVKQSGGPQTCLNTPGGWPWPGTPLWKRDEIDGTAANETDSS